MTVLSKAKPHQSRRRLCKLQAMLDYTVRPFTTSETCDNLTKFEVVELLSLDLSEFVYPDEEALG